MDNITFGGVVFTPTIILGIAEAREARTIVHDILGRAAPDVTIRPAALRSGTLELGFAGLTADADSRALADAAATGALGRYGAMAFVVAEGGRIERAIEDSTRAAWVVRIDYQEVVA